MLSDIAQKYNAALRQFETDTVERRYWRSLVFVEITGFRLLTLYLSAAAPPFLIEHGTLDRRVPIGQSRQLHAPCARRVSIRPCPNMQAPIAASGASTGRESCPTWHGFGLEFLCLLYD